MFTLQVVRQTPSPLAPPEASWSSTPPQNCHPAYTGVERAVASGSRIERFEQRRQLAEESEEQFDHDHRRTNPGLSRRRRGARLDGGRPGRGLHSRPRTRRRRARRARAELEAREVDVLTPVRDRAAARILSSTDALTLFMNGPVLSAAHRGRRGRSGEAHRAVTSRRRSGSSTPTCGWSSRSQSTTRHAMCHCAT